MAKQNVNFIQRHVEKFVVGLTGLVLLAALVFYGIQTPNTTSVGGEDLPPGAFYQQIEQKAATALDRMKSARPDGALLDPLPEGITAGKLDIPAPVATVWVPPTPGLTQVSLPGGGRVEKIRMAGILPPSRPVLTTGRGRAALPDTTKLFLTSAGRADNRGDGGGAPRGIGPSPAMSGVDLPIRECYWVTVTSALFNKEQIAMFKAAKYHDNRMEFTVAGFDVARQELLPDGQWGPATRVTPYRPRNLLPDDVPMRRMDDDSYAVDPPAAELLDQYRAEIQSKTRQNETLRPSFSAYLTDAYKTEWKLPDLLPGVNVDLTLFTVQETQRTVLMEETRETRPGRRTERNRDIGHGPGDTDASDRERKRLLAQKLEEAKKALDEKRFLEAVVLLDEIEKNADDQLRLEARRLRIRNENEIKTAQAADRRPSMEVQTLDIEPAWINDTTVLPGRTYRYRLRVLAVNNYFGYDTPLSNPDDAKKLLLAGAWSEWSSPITVRDDTYLILDRLAVQPAGQPPLASVEVYHWSNGIWSSGKTDVGIGQRIAVADADFNFEYDGVIVDIQPNRPFLQRNENPKDGTLSVRPRSSPGITVVNARGEVREHIATEDRVVRETIKAEIKAVLEAGPSRGGPTPGLRAPERGMFRGEEDRGGGRRELEF